MGWNCTNPLNKQIFINRYDLRDIYNRISGKSGFLTPATNITWRANQTQVRGYQDANRRFHSALVELVRLDENNRMAVPWPGTGRRRQGSPPDLASPHHHSSRPTDRLWIRAIKGSSEEFSVAYTAFSASVMRLPDCA